MSNLYAKFVKILEICHKFSDGLVDEPRLLSSISKCLSSISKCNFLGEKNNYKTIILFKNI